MNHSRSKEWGDTRSKEGSGRRVYVGNLNPQAQISDLQKFFGPVEKLDGISIGKNFAFIQFKRPSDAAQAITNHNLRFMDRPIYVRFYRDGPKSPDMSVPNSNHDHRGHASSRPSRSRAAANARRHLKSTRERSTSADRNRNRSRSVSPYPNENFSRDNDTSTMPSRSALTPWMMTSAIDDFHKEEAARAIKEAQARYLVSEKNNTSVLSHQSNVRGNMPDDVFLTLQLAISQKTARDLSLNQVCSVLRYFESERDFIESSMGVGRNHLQQSGPIGPSIINSSAVLNPSNNQTVQERCHESAAVEEDADEPASNDNNSQEQSPELRQEFDDFAQLLRDVARR